MSREELAALAARWRASGATADEARLLRWRVYYGDLAEEALDLAAHLGHPGARAALGDDVLPEVGPLSAWVRRIWGPWPRRGVLPTQRELERPAPARRVAAQPPPPRALSPPDPRDVALAAFALVRPRLHTVDLQPRSRHYRRELARLNAQLQALLGEIEQGWLRVLHVPAPLRAFLSAQHAESASAPIVIAIEALADVVELFAAVWEHAEVTCAPAVERSVTLAARVASLEGEPAVRAAIQGALVSRALLGADTLSREVSS